MRNQVFIFILLLIASCQIDRKPTIDRSRLNFKTSDDSYLFFKNVRQIYYDVKEIPQAHWKAYRYSDRDEDTARPVITNTIVVDEMKQEAYLLLESNEFLSEKDNLFTITETTKLGVTYEYSLKQQGRENMLEFATKIYEGIMADNLIQIKVDAQVYPLFITDEDKESFQVVMGDFYRLTGVF